MGELIIEDDVFILFVKEITTFAPNYNRRSRLP